MKVGSIILTDIMHKIKYTIKIFYTSKVIS